MEPSELSFGEARAVIRHRVRSRLSEYRGQDVLTTFFLVDRLDLAAEAYAYQGARKPDGRRAKLEDLIDIVKEELRDFILLEDERQQVNLPAIEAEITCEECSRVYDPSSQARCPTCDCPNLFQMAQLELDTLVEHLHIGGDDPIARRALAGIGRLTVETTYTRVVSCFETFHKRLNDLAFSEARTPPARLRRRNLFQNIPDARGWFLEHHGLDPCGQLNAGQVRLLDRVFNKRHVIEHNGGVIDEAYRRRTGCDPADVGDPVPTSRQEVLKAIGLVKNIVQATSGVFV